MLKQLRRLRSGAFLRPVLYKLLARLALGLAAALLWDRFTNRARLFSIFEYAFLFVGVIFAAACWLSYLRLDGVRAPEFIKRLPRKQAKRKMGDMIDYVDDRSNPYDELEPDDLTLCAFAANALCAVLFLLPPLVLAFV